MSDDYLASLGRDDEDMFSGLCQVQAVDDYTGEVADEPVWIEPRRFDTDTDPVRLRKPRRDDQDSAQGASAC